MFQISHRPAPIETWVLTDAEASSAAEVVPGRGGILSRFRVGGTPVITCDDGTLYDAGPMPLHAGLHPYFFVPQSEKALTRIATAATRAFDNVTKGEVPFTGFDLTAFEVDLHLVDHGSTEGAIDRPDGTHLSISGSAEFSRWVVWTLAGKDFVCLEPWTAPADALNTRQGLLFVPPGERRVLAVTIRCRS